MNDFFTADITKQAVQFAGEDITNGTYIVMGIGSGLIKFLTSETGAPPESENRGAPIQAIQQNHRYDLGIGEKLYCWADEGTVEFMVVRA